MENELKIDDITLHYTVSGDPNAPVIILLHGWGCQGSTLASIEKVAAEKCRVYALDFPGFGKSTEPPTVWGVDDYTRMLEKFVRAENISNPALLGHSFGGRVGIVYSSRNQVSKLILVDAAGIKPRRSLKYYYKVYTYKLGCRMMRIMLGKEKARQRIEAMRAARGSSDYNNATPMMRRILSRIVNEDLKHLMPQIKAPTLLIWGENDTATPLADAKTMERLIPDAGLVSFPGCGHYSFLDNPSQFSAVLRSFLNS